MTGSDRRDLIHMAEVAVDMDRQDRHGALCDQRFDLRWIERKVIGINVAEYRREAVSHDGVRGGNKGEGGRDNLAALRKMKGGDQFLER